MKRNSVFTKLLAMLLCVMMVIGCLPLSVFAEEDWEGDIDVADPIPGSEEDPFEATLGDNAVAEDAADYNWVYTAEYTETLIITSAAAITVNDTAYELAEDATEVIVELAVTEGDEVKIYSESFNLAYPVGSVGNPIDLTNDLIYEEDFTATVTVPAGTTYNYIAYRVGGMIMTINDGEGVTCATMGMMYPYSWTITNDGAEDAEYVINVAYPEGSVNNPAVAYLGDNTASIAAGTDGYYWTYTAEKAGDLIITISGDENWTYAVNNITAGTYGDTQWSDSDPVVNPTTITVAEGDVIKIMMNGYDPDAWEAPAAELTVNLAYKANVPAGTITQFANSLSFESVVYINNYFKIEGFEGLTQEYILANGGLLVWNTKVTEEEAVYGYGEHDVRSIVYASNYNAYMGQTDGIPAAEYSMERYIRAFIKMENGTYVYGPVIEYSPQAYCENQINKATAKQTLKNACIAMLHYGAAAQIRFNTNTGDLANANIANTHMNFAYDSNWIDVPVVPTTSLAESNKVTFAGNSVSFEGAVYINYYYTTTVTAVKAELLFWKNVSVELTEGNVTDTVEMTLVDAKTNRYHATSATVPPAEYGDALYACAKFTDAEGNVYYSAIRAYNPEVYASSQISKTSTSAEQKAVCESMVIYGEYVKRHFFG